MPKLLTALALGLAIIAQAPPIVSPAPYTEVEQLRIQNVQLEGIVLQRQLDDWTAKRAKLKADLEAARPGFLWDPQSGQFTLKPQPEPKK